MSDSEGDSSDFDQLPDADDDVELERELNAGIASLFNPNDVAPTSAQLYADLKQHYGFDFDQVAKKYRLDVYGRIRLVNYIRSFPFTQTDPRARVQEVLAALPKAAAELRTSEQLLVPVIQGDPLIMAIAQEDSDWSDSESEDGDEVFLNEGKARGHGNDPEAEQEQDTEKKASTTTAKQSVQDENAAFEAGLMTPEEELAYLRQQNRQLLTQKTKLQNQVEELVEALNRVRANYAQVLLSEADMKGLEAEAANPAKSTMTALEEKEVDDAYFGSYSKLGIHWEMLRDTHRTESYRDAIFNNADRLFKGKVVLDVGCGTGILSMFAAKAGARRVIGVDAADVIDVAKEIIAANGFADVITLVKGKVEEISLPADVKTVDVIVSEWMGYFLLFESMLPSVLFARDKWLRRAAPANMSVYEASQTAGALAPNEVAKLPFADDATLFPDVAKMFVMPIEMQYFYQRQQGYWKSVYGFNMQPIVKFYSQQHTPGARVMVASEDGACIMGIDQTLTELDLIHAQDRDLDFVSTTRLPISKSGPVEAVCVHFDVQFVRGCDNPVILSTSPRRPATHWRQTVLQFDHIIHAKEGDEIECAITARRASDNRRSYSIEMTYTFIPRDPSTVSETPEYDYPAGASKAEPGVMYHQIFEMR